MPSCSRIWILIVNGVSNSNRKLSNENLIKMYVNQHTVAGIFGTWNPSVWNLWLTFLFDEWNDKKIIISFHEIENDTNDIRPKTWKLSVNGWRYFLERLNQTFRFYQNIPKCKQKSSIITSTHKMELLSFHSILSSMSIYCVIHIWKQQKEDKQPKWYIFFIKFNDILSIITIMIILKYLLRLIQCSTRWLALDCFVLQRNRKRYVSEIK